MNGEYDILKRKAELLDEFVETGVRWELLHAYIKMFDRAPSKILEKIYYFYELEKRYGEEE